MKIPQTSTLRYVLWSVVAIAIAYVMVPLGEHFDYLDGKRLTPRSELLLPVSFALGGCLAFPLCVRLRRGQGGGNPGGKLLISTLAALVFFAPCVFFLVLRKPSQVNFTKGFLSRLERDVDPQELQNWASMELSTHWRNKSDPATDSQVGRDLPNSIKNLSKWPPNINVDMLESDMDAPHLGIVWGSGFGHWGILVGSKEFAPPSLRGFFFVQWRPSIYIFFSE